MIGDGENNKKKIIIRINFNHYDLYDKKYDLKWIEYRMNIFYNYTLKSLQSQSFQNYQCFLLYDIKTENLIQDTLKKYVLPENIIFTHKLKINEQEQEYLQDSNILLLARIDSDDMYHCTYLERLYNFNYKQDTQVIISQKGYIYNLATDTIATYYDQSPPFYCFIYNVNDYINGYRYQHGLGHTEIIKDLNYEIIDGHNYMVIVHKENHSSNFNMKQKQKVISSSILKHFLK